MDAVKFIEERDRMCATSESCHACSANRHGCIFNYPSNNTAKEQVKVLEEWLKENSRKTRQSVFLKQWPNAQTDVDNVLLIRPCNVDAKMADCCLNRKCVECRYEFWMQEVE